MGPSAASGKKTHYTRAVAARERLARASQPEAFLIPQQFGNAAPQQSQEFSIWDPHRDMLEALKQKAGERD